jgi:VanZ family protein
MDRKTVTRLLMVAAWMAIIAIAYATLARIGFVYSVYYKLAPLLIRLEIKTYVQFMHVVAFALLGALFTFAYPGRILVVSCIVIGGATLLEFAQTLTPDRHGTLMDALEKIAGGAAGILLVRTIQHFRVGKIRTD